MSPLQRLAEALEVSACRVPGHGPNDPQESAERGYALREEDFVLLEDGRWISAYDSAETWSRTFDAAELRTIAALMLEEADELEGRPHKAPSPNPPLWLMEWLSHGATGLSSKTIAHALTSTMGWCEDPDAPYDGDDVGRCIQLLDLAAQNGEDWRARLPEVAAACPVWAPLVPIWPAIEAAYHEDIEAARRARAFTKAGRPRKLQTYKSHPPSRCWWLIRTARGGAKADPYAHLSPHPFKSEVTHG